MSEDLFRCRRCGEVKDKDEKNGITVTKWATKSSAKASLCGACFTNHMNQLDFKMGDWKEWPKRSRRGDDD